MGTALKGTKRMKVDRITFRPAVMGGGPCIHGLRVMVGTIVGLIAPGRTPVAILKLYPYKRPISIRPLPMRPGGLKRSIFPSLWHGKSDRHEPVTRLLGEGARIARSVI